MTSHEFDLYCNAVALEEPPYHEQLLIMQQFEETREATLKQQGGGAIRVAVHVLHNS